MAYNITELLASRKVTDGILVVVMILLGTASFGLGRLSVSEAPQEKVALCQSARYTQEGQVAGVIKPLTEISQQTGQFVASRNGTAYHFPWCSGAQRIKEENKVWFATHEEAQQAGYRKAANCKGL